MPSPLPQEVLLKIDPRASGDLAPPFTILPEKDLDHQPLEDVLLEVFDLTASFMEARRVPDHLMLAAYRKGMGCVDCGWCGGGVVVMLYTAHQC